MAPHRKLGIYVGYHSSNVDCIFDECHFLALEGDYKYHWECQEINWDDKSIISSDPRTKKTELQVQKIINLKNVANNLPHVFTDYKCVTKSWNPVVNATERVEVPKKTTQPPVVKRGRVTTTKRDNAHNKRPRNEKTRPLHKTVNVSQPVVDRHFVDIPQSSTQARYRNENASMSKNPDDLILENHETSTGIQEVFINYTSSREVYNRSTTIVNPCFSTITTENFLTDPDPKTMVECKRHLNWNKWKEGIEVELNSLKKRKVSKKKWKQWGGKI
jgi:hypothetical protein